jgi:arsenate reductase (thioredoxin)
MASHTMTPAERMCLHSAARDLHTEFRGIFGQETIESLLSDSYNELASTATVTRWLVIGAERFARQRLQALAHAESTAKDKLPAVLFLCVHNAGRSQMALGWFNHLSAGRAIAWSGGSEPVSGINPGVLAAMAEAGIDISREFSKPWTTSSFSQQMSSSRWAVATRARCCPASTTRNGNSTTRPARHSRRSARSATKSGTG